ncbi:hypothetical protein HHX47_DHR8000494, partial [Lentinula edodes]
EKYSDLGALPSSESTQSILLSVLSALGSAGICSQTLAEHPGFADDFFIWVTASLAPQSITVSINKSPSPMLPLS